LKISRSAVILLLVLLVAVPFTAVASTDNTLRYGINLAQLGNLDIHYTTASAPFVAAYQIVEPLISKDNEGGLFPLLVKQMPVISEDGLVYSLELKENVLFHDGSKLTTADVLATFKKLLDPTNVSVHAGLLTGLLEGASEYSEGNADEISGINIIDDYRFTLTLKSPNVSFLNTLSAYWMSIYPEEAVSIPGWGAATLVGTGPFQVKEFRPQESLTLERFDAYHGGPKSIDEIVMLHMDENTALMEFEAGNIDITGLSNPSLTQWYLNSDEFKDNVYRIEQKATVALSFNKTMEPFDNPKVREAIGLAINRDEIVNSLMHGLYSPAKSFLPYGILGYHPELPPYELNYERAKELLREAGYTNGLNITAVTTDSASTTVILQYLEQALKAADIHLTIQTYDAAGFNDLRGNGKVPMFILTWVSDSGDPNDFLNLYSTPMSQFISNFYMNEEFDKGLAAGLSEADPVKREKIYQELDYKLTRVDFAAAPIMHPNAFMLVADRVSNLTLNNVTRLFDAELK